MKKIFVLLFSVLFFTTMVSANGTADVKKIALEKYHQKVKKTEPKEFGLFDFLFEEEETSQETEQDYVPAVAQLSSQTNLFPNHFVLLNNNQINMHGMEPLVVLQNPMYITFRNLRL